MNRIWKRWQTVTTKVASIQANVALFIIYCIFIVPLGMFLKLFLPKVLLGHRYKKKKKSLWLEYTKTTYDMSFAQKQ
jgi:hypothetical protein